VVKTFLDCVPCFLRQALEASRFASDSGQVHDRIIRRVLEEVAGFSFQLSPPSMGQIIHRIVREETGHPDPYQEEKVRCNRAAAKLYPQLKKRVAGAPRPMDFALRLAVAGNVIDLGPPGLNYSASPQQVMKTAQSQDLAIDDGADFWPAVSEARDILYLGDNAGEIFFDRLLLEYLPAEKITFVVRGGPIINDMTLNDLDGTGLEDIVGIMENGSDAPGTVLQDCSPEFRRHFDAADLILSKGQGNYESLSGIKNKRIFFLLKAKCSVLARDLGVPEGSMVVKKSGPDSR
jgi:uncharacterized protein with ATP-grasp and redox domains